jgi:integrase
VDPVLLHVLHGDGDVRRLTTKPKKQQDYRTSFPGLQLRHYSSGAKTWFVQARINGGPPLWVGLGEYPDMKFAAAELACAQARAKLREGVDPRREEQVERDRRAAASMKFGEAAKAWIETKKVWRPATVAKVESVLLGGRLKPWHDKLVAEITEEDIEGLLEALSPNTKQTYLAPIRGFMKWSMRKGYVAKSPATGISAPMPEGDAAPLIKFEEEGEPDLSELKAFLACLAALPHALPGAPWPNIYRLGLLTGARYSEIVGLTWDEIDLEGAVWTLPESRSKVKIECKRPLSKAAVELLRSIPKRKHFVFPGRIEGNTLSKTGRAPAILTAMLAASGHKTGFWYGRLRDTVASWLEFQQDAPERAMAVILNHKPPTDNTRRKHYVQISGFQQARVLIERWASVVQS